METRRAGRAGNLRRAASALFLLCLVSQPAAAAPTPPEQFLLGGSVANRVEATTILGGDYGIGGGTYTTAGKNDSGVDITVNKFGGSGDIGAPRQLGQLDIGWQPQVQGSMGFLTAKNHFHNLLNGGDVSKYSTFAIQFGGGARFWLSDNFSIAPTLMGMYGHTENQYSAVSEFGRAYQADATRSGLINWNVDTWTIRPSLDFQYQYVWRRTIFTLSTEPTYFHSQNFGGSWSLDAINGNSEVVKNKFDVDVPLGVELWGHELRTGGYFERQDIFGDLKDGLGTGYIYQAHGRIVLDCLGQLWKVQWIGLGTSYLWGGNFKGWSIGADVAFRF